MNIIERGKSLRPAFGGVGQSVGLGLAALSAVWGHRHGQEWRPEGASLDAGGAEEVRIQRHLCYACGGSYSEASPFLVRGSWYAREVHRFAVDHWQHVGSSLRRTAEIVRSLLGKQERWLLWRLFASVEPGEGEQCHLGQATVERWLDRAGIEARKERAGAAGGGGDFGAGGDGRAVGAAAERAEEGGARPGGQR